MSKVFYTVPWVPWLPSDVQLTGNLIDNVNDVIGDLYDNGIATPGEIADRTGLDILDVMAAMLLAQEWGLVEQSARLTASPGSQACARDIEADSAGPPAGKAA